MSALRKSINLIAGGDSLLILYKKRHLCRDTAEVSLIKQELRSLNVLGGLCDNALEAGCETGDALYLAGDNDLGSLSVSGLGKGF